MSSLLKHISELETVRHDEASTMAALHGLLAQIQEENAKLKEQNASHVAELRLHMPPSRGSTARSARSNSSN